MENNNEQFQGFYASEAWQAFRKQVVEAAYIIGRAFGELADEIAKKTIPALQELRAALESNAIAEREWQMAQLWAYGARPEWMRIYNRTKKRRTRKKYRDKVLRAYRKEHAGRG